MDAKYKWASDQLDGSVSFRETLGQTKVMQICQGETLNHQGVITHEVCCLAAQFQPTYKFQLPYCHSTSTAVDQLEKHF